MIVRRFLHREPAVAPSYLIGCGGKAVAAVIDPVDPPESYLRAAEQLATRLRFVVDGTGGTMQLRAATIEVAGAPARP